MRLSQAALDTPLDSPFSATLSVHGSPSAENSLIDLVRRAASLISEASLAAEAPH